jgi:replicative DNA helicase
MEPMPSKYNDTAATMQVIGCIYINQKYLDYEDKYVITEDDFVDEFHKIVYGTIYKLHELGVEKITPAAVNDFLETRPKSKGIFNLNKGTEYLNKIKEVAQPLSFDYYYNRLKKMSLLRAYEKIGYNVDKYYDPDNILDLKKKQLQEEWFDNTSLEQIADTINQKIEEIYQTHVKNDIYGMSTKAGDGIEELVASFEKNPDVGVPLYGKYVNTITRGARLGKFYLRSAATGIGKSRSMIADVCNIACS